MNKELKSLLREKEAIYRRCNCGTEAFFANCDNCKVYAEKLESIDALEAYWNKQGPNPCEIIIPWKDVSR